MHNNINKCDILLGWSGELLLLLYKGQEWC